MFYFFSELFCQMLNDEVICFVMRRNFHTELFTGIFLVNLQALQKYMILCKHIKWDSFYGSWFLWVLIWIEMTCIVMKISAIFFSVLMFGFGGGFVFFFLVVGFFFPCKGFQQEEEIRYIIVIHNDLCMLQKSCLLCSHRDTLCM